MTNLLSSKYLKLLGTKKSAIRSEGFQRKAIIHLPHEISQHLAQNLLSNTEERLRLEYEKSIDGNEDHLLLIKFTIENAAKGLSVIVNEGDEGVLSNEEALAFEAIVIANDTRPSIKVDDVFAKQYSNLKEWKTSFAEFRSQILQMSASVGRIDKNGVHQGTGFVVAPGLIMTNRHVLQELAVETQPNIWNFKDNLTINFGVNTYKILPSVAFAGEDRIEGNVDFGRTDIALLRCEVNNRELPDPIVFKREKSDLMKGRYVYTLGYPGNPGPGNENFIVLRKLFNYEFGVKRVSPGEIDAAIGDLPDDNQHTVFEHDCTTLGGNSGSPVIDFDETGLGVFGIHFAGAKRVGNFAHAMAAFRNQFEELGIKFK